MKKNTATFATFATSPVNKGVFGVAKCCRCCKIKVECLTNPKNCNACNKTATLYNSEYQFIIPFVAMLQFF